MSLKKPAPLGELAGEIRKVGTTPVDSSNTGIHYLTTVSAFHFWEFPDSSGPFLLHHLIFQVTPRSTRDVLLGVIQKFQSFDFEESSWLISRVVGRLSSSLRHPSSCTRPWSNSAGNYILSNLPILKSLLDYHQGSSYVSTSSSSFHSLVPERTLWGFATKLPHHNLQVSDEYLTVPAKQIVR